MRPTSDTDSDVHDTHRESVHPEANVPSPSPWAEAPGQREPDSDPGSDPDRDGQLYVGAAHPDTEVTPEEAARHEPVPVDESGEPIDRADDEPAAHDEAAEAHDEAAHAHDEAAHAHEEAARAHDEPTKHDEPTEHDELAAHDEATAHDEPTEQHEEPVAHEPARDDPAAGEPPLMQPIPIGAAPVDAAHGQPAQVVAVPTDRDESAEPTAEPAPDGAAAELKPGDVPVAPVTAFLADQTAQDLRQRWREAQLGFVDDPQQAAEDVRNLVNEAIDAVTAALSSQRDALSGEAGGDTEHYRVTVQRCRALFDRLLNL